MEGNGSTGLTWAEADLRNAQNNETALSSEGYTWFPRSNTNAQYSLTQYIKLPVENVTIQMVRMCLLTINLENYAFKVENKNPTVYHGPAESAVVLASERGME